MLISKENEFVLFGHFIIDFITIFFFLQKFGTRTNWHHEIPGQETQMHNSSVSE